MSSPAKSNGFQHPYRQFIETLHNVLNSVGELYVDQRVVNTIFRFDRVFEVILKRVRPVEIGIGRMFPAKYKSDPDLL